MSRSVVLLTVGVALAGLAWLVAEHPGTGAGDALVPSPSPPTGESAGAESEPLASPERAAVAGPRRAARDDPFDPARPLTVVHGLVYDARTDSPVAGAGVRLLAPGVAREVASGSDGRFAVEWPDALPAAVEVAHREYVDTRVARLVPGGALELALERSGRIEGVVVCADFVPRAPARVALWGDGGERRTGAPIATAVCDERGRFAFEDLASANYALVALSSGGPPVLETGVHFAPGGRSSVTIVLSAGAELSGRVVLEDTGEPVPGAALSLRRGGGAAALADFATREVVTGPDGGFTVAGLGPGRHLVRGRTPWGAPVKGAVGDPRSAAPQVFSVPAPAKLTGTVRDADGAGVAGAAVHVVLENRAKGGIDLEAPQGDETVSTLTCDGEGRFDLELPSRQVLRIVARHPTRERLCGTHRVTLSPRSGYDATIELMPGARLAGVVLDADERGIGGVEVRPLSRAGPVPLALAAVETRSDGRFELTDLPVGKLRIEVRKEGFRERRADLSLREGTQGEFVIRLEAAVPLAGRVVGEGGVAVPHARVSASGGPRGGAGQTRTVRADEFGRFEFPHLRGTWRVQARARGWVLPKGSAPLVSVPEETYVVLEMKPRAVVARASVAGEIEGAGGEPVAGLAFAELGRATLGLSGGRFRITGLQPGRTRLVAQAPGHEPLAIGPLELVPGGHLEIGRHVLRRFGQVRVNVLGPDGDALSAAAVRLERLGPAAGGAPGAPEHIALAWGRGQRHVSREVWRGAWRLRVRHPNFARHVRVVRIERAVTGLVVRLEPRAPSTDAATRERR